MLRSRHSFVRRFGICIGLAFGLLVGLGCAETVTTRSHPALAKAGPLRLVAVAPFRASGALAKQTDPSRGTTSSEALEVVAHQVSEALTRRGIQVIPPSDVARALGGRPAPDERLIPREVAQLVKEQWGADAVVFGEAWRFRERSGQAAGSRSAASVGFELTLHKAPAGQRLWTGTFDETQQPMTANVLTTAQYPGGGMRWLTVEELLRWGADQTVMVMPLGQ